MLATVLVRFPPRQPNSRLPPKLWRRANSRFLHRVRSQFDHDDRSDEVDPIPDQAPFTIDSSQRNCLLGHLSKTFTVSSKFHPLGSSSFFEDFDLQRANAHPTISAQRHSRLQPTRFKKHRVAGIGLLAITFALKTLCLACSLS